MIVLLIIICILLGFLSIISFFIAHNENEQKKKAEKELQEVEINEQKVTEIMAEASQTKADARTGDHSADIKYMADKLHHFANK